MAPRGKEIPFKRIKAVLDELSDAEAQTILAGS